MKVEWGLLCSWRLAEAWRYGDRETRRQVYIWRPGEARWRRAFADMTTGDVKHTRATPSTAIKVFFCSSARTQSSTQHRVQQSVASSKIVDSSARYAGGRLLARFVERGSDATKKTSLCAAERHYMLYLSDPCSISHLYLKANPAAWKWRDLAKLQHRCRKA
jgi:hypothetical protein